MDLKRKIELTEQHVRSISRHDDADMAIREAALAKVEKCIAAEREAMAARVAEVVAGLA